MATNVYIGAKRELPGGYTQVAYIRGTGTQYINTGVNPTQYTGVTIDVKLNSTISANGVAVVFGCHHGSIYYRLITGLGQRWGLGYEYGGTFSNYWYMDALENLNTRRIITTDGVSATIDGVTKTYSAQNFQITDPLYLLANNSAGSVGWITPGEIYACQIRENGTLVRDFIPCKNASSVAGLYDAVNGVFYGNAGTGSFIAGPELNGVARKVKNIYVGVGGKARKVLKAYVGVNGKARLCYQALTAWQRYSIGNTIKETVEASGSMEITFASGSTVDTFLYGTSIAVDSGGNLYIPNAETVLDYMSGGYKKTQLGYIKIRNEFYKVTSTSGNAILALYNFNGCFMAYSASGSTHRHTASLLSVSQTQGSLIDTVYAEEGTYPDNGVQDGYWYVKVS